MSITETPPAAPTAAPKKPRRHARANRKPKAVAAPAAKPSVLAGLTITDCPSGCNAERCVISGVGICAHPGKGGLQASLQTPEALTRFHAAKRMLGKQKLDLTGYE